MKIIFKFLPIILFIGIAMANSTSTFNSQKFTLSNGLQVVLIPNHLAPVVSVGLIYKVGTADDPVANVGLSHFLEHMMFKGTKNIPTDRFKKIIIENGGNTNAWTYYDQTVYDTQISADKLDLILQLEADRMVNLAFTEEEVKKEKEVVMQERLMRLENNPFGLVMEAYLKSLYWYHPYGVPPIGYPHHIKSYNYKNTFEHYKRWYATNNAVLVVAGDVTIQTLKPLVEKHFASIPENSNLPKRIRPQEPNHGGVTQNIVQYNKRNANIELVWFFKSPSYRTLEKKELYFALQVLAEAMAGNETRPFYRKIVEDLKLALGFSASYDDHALDPMCFQVSASLSPQMNVEATKKVIIEYLQHLLHKGISEEELAKAKRDLIANLAFARDGTHNSMNYFYNMAIDFTVEDIESWSTNIGKVTKEQVLEAAKLIFDIPPIAIIELYPSEATPKGKL